MIFLEIFLILLVGYIFVTQIFIPMIKNLPIFPLFRSESSLRNKIIEQNARLSDIELKKEILKKQQEVAEAEQEVVEAEQELAEIEKELAATRQEIAAENMKSHNTTVDKS